MCLLINQPKQTNLISESKLRTAFDANPDGVGFAFGDGQRVQIRKFRKFKKFLDAYHRSFEKYGKTSDFVIHFRWTTHGINSGTFNVHPFQINDGLAFAHNGVIHKVDDDQKLSDTQVFNRDILKPLSIKNTINPVVLLLIQEYIGNGSKLAFVNRFGQSQIVNEKAGHYLDNIWYSNRSYESAGACYSNPMYGIWKPTRTRNQKAGLKLKQSAYCNTCGIKKAKSELTSIQHLGGYNYYECNDCSNYFNPDVI